MNRLDLSDSGSRVFGKILRRQAEEAGDARFLVTGDATLTFADTDRITNAIAAGLKALGLGRGDRIGLYTGNRLEVVLLALAANKIGAVWTPICPDYKGDWLANALVQCRCAMLVVDDPNREQLEAVSNRLSLPPIILISGQSSQHDGAYLRYSDLLGHPPLQSDYSEQSYGDDCAILWTSGTTGKSKGVRQSYNCWIRAIVDGASMLFDSREGDTIFCVLPLFNSSAWITSIFRALLEGIPCVLEPRFSVTNFWQQVNSYEATQIHLLGAMGVFLLDAPERPDDAENSLRTVQAVGLPPALWPVFEKRFGVRMLRLGFGMSECLMGLTQKVARDDVPPYALGYPGDDVAVELCDDSGHPVAPGQPGELCIKPLRPHTLFNGYFDNPDADAAAWRGEWFLTGDIARMDPSTGAYFYVDRKKDAVRFAGRNISTLEVESVVRRHPAVAQVAAFGITSEKVESEQELKINIVLAPGHSPAHEEICAFINDNAPFYFVPRYIEFVDSLPYTPTNKLQKFKLREAGINDMTWDLKKSAYEVRR